MLFGSGLWSQCLSVCSDSSVSPSGLTPLQTAPRKPPFYLLPSHAPCGAHRCPTSSSVLKVFSLSENPAHPLVHNNPLKCLLSWPASLTHHRFQAYLCLFPGRCSWASLFSHSTSALYCMEAVAECVQQDHTGPVLMHSHRTGLSLQ
jgi:hypothetical protein